MLVGYMRVSSADDRQTVDLQRDALVAAGVDPRNLHTDKASGARDEALLQRLAAVRGRLSLCADQAAAAKWWLSMPMALSLIHISEPTRPY